MTKRTITLNDHLIYELLKDPNYRVERSGRIWTRVRATGKPAGWRETGCLNHTCHRQVRYLKLKYRGVILYVQRIVYAAFCRPLDSQEAVNHKNLNGLPPTTSQDDYEKAEKIRMEKFRNFVMVTN